MSNFSPDLFLKPVAVAEDHTVTFKHLKKKYHLTAECFSKPEDLAGKTVLIDTGLAVFRNHKQLGRATEASA